MSERQQKRGYEFKRGYQAKIDKPLRNPPTGGSNVKPPPKSEKDKK